MSNEDLLQKTLNPVDIKWPQDPSGITSNLKKAMTGLGNVKSVESAKIVMEVSKIFQEWFPQRFKQNKAADKFARDRKAKRVAAENEAARKAGLEAQRAELALMEAKTEDLRAALAESEKG